MMEDISVKRKGGKPNRSGGNFRGRGGGSGSSGGRGGGGRGRGSGSERGGPYRGRGGGPHRGRGGGPPPGRGGASQEGRGGGGGWSSSRKGGFDLDDLMDGPVVNNPYSVPVRKPPRLNSTSLAETAPPVKSRPKVKVEMQNLYMSEENQDMLKETLLSLRLEEAGLNNEDDDFGDYEPQDYEADYDELDYRAEDQYWMPESGLVIEEVKAHSKPTVLFGDGESGTHHLANPYAVNKLQRCGFNKEYCLEALQISDGDTGAALEYLLNDLYDITLDPHEDDHSDSVDEELLIAREEEKTALHSIYDTAFEERIVGKVWVLNFDLPEMWQVLKRIYPVIKPNSQVSTKEKKKESKKMCSFFLSGKCKYNENCRLSHSKPNDEAKDRSHPIYEKYKEIDREKGPQPFFIEVRFPAGNKYPQEAPLVAFTSVVEEFPPHAILNISLFLMNQAREAALDHLPCVFTLVSSLEDADKLEELLRLPAPSTKAQRSPASQMPTLDTGSKMLDAGGKNTERTEQDRELDATSTDKSSFEHLKKKPRDDYNTSTNPNQLRTTNNQLQVDFKKKQKMKGYLSMQAKRQQLPAWDMKELILEVLADNQVVVISGMTGCGKTTQVPQFILDEALQQKEFSANVICTQPRRISAMAVAQRVADERSEKLGKSVGYKIRLESVASSQTRLLFCTTGIILRRLESDPLLEGVSHIVIDEVHERSEESDFLLMILRDVLESRSDLKVILMSATLNAQLFSDYFNGCPVLEIPGRTFPVQQFFLEDALEFTEYKIEHGSPYSKQVKKLNTTSLFSKGSRHDFDDAVNEEELEHVLFESAGPAKDRVGDKDLTLSQLKMRYEEYSTAALKTLERMDLDKINFELIVEVLLWITSKKNKFESEGAILVFLPGYAEIQTLYDALLSTSEFGTTNKRRYKIIPLHSSLSSEDQNAVFQKAEDGIIKIVIATNIAETSITIDDVVYVVDAGKMKEKRYDQSKSMESLETVWVSRANALQRQGRAGRVQEGICFHLFTSHHFSHLKRQPIPEIQRAPLEQLVLKIKILPAFQGCRVESVLESLIEAPSEEAIDGAVKRLQDLGALDLNGELNPLGYHLGYLPVDVRIGKLMLYGAIFRCLDSALTVAAALSFKSPFVAPFGSRQQADERKKLFAMGNSDHLTILNAYKRWMETRKRGNYKAFEFCQNNFLSIKTLQMLSSLKQQYVELLSDIGFIRPGIRLRDVERAGRGQSDGVAEIIGSEANVNSDNWSLISAMLVGALYPNIVQVLTPETQYHESSAGAVKKDRKAQELRFKTKLDGHVSIHPSSVNFQAHNFSSPYLVFHEKVKTTKVYIRDCSMVSVYQLLLFGGGAINIDLYQGHFIMSVCDSWIQFKASCPKIAELLRDLRHELDELLSDKISQPELDLLTCPRGSKIINCIVSLVSSQR